MGEYIPTEWVDGKKFLELLKPYIRREKPRRGKLQYIVNGNRLVDRNQDRELLYQIETNKRERVHLSRAEELLINVDLDPHIVDEVDQAIA
jgi:hypothetical protein